MSHVATEVVRYKDVEGRGRTWSGDIFFDYNILIKIVTIYFLVNKMTYPPSTPLPNIYIVGKLWIRSVCPRVPSQT